MSHPTTTTDSQKSSQGLFPATQWTRIRQAAVKDKEGDVALAEICRVYWYPMFATARFKHALNHHQAEDLTQAFWA